MSVPPTSRDHCEEPEICFASWACFQASARAMNEPFDEVTQVGQVMSYSKWLIEEDSQIS